MHQKRLSAPKILPIPRKEHKFTVKTMPGPHPKERAIPLLIIVRDILKYCSTYREAKSIIARKEIYVDGRPIRHHQFPVGVMDVITVPRLKHAFRVLPTLGEKLTLHPIAEDEAQFKIVRINGKRLVKGGKLQLNSHDGRSFLFDLSDVRRDKKLKKYSVGDSLKISLPDQEILEHLPLKEGMFGLIVFGKNMGKVGKIEKITPGTAFQKPLVTLSYDGHEVTTLLEYMIIIGKDEPEITLPEEILKWPEIEASRT